MNHKSLFYIIITLFFIFYSFSYIYAESYHLQSFIFYDLKLPIPIGETGTTGIDPLKPSLIDTTLNIWLEKHPNIKIYRINEVSKTDKLLILIWYTEEENISLKNNDK